MEPSEIAVIIRHKFNLASRFKQEVMQLIWNLGQILVIAIVYARIDFDSVAVTIFVKYQNLDRIAVVMVEFND
jgi:hypothetical protein